MFLKNESLLGRVVPLLELFVEAPAVKADPLAQVVGHILKVHCDAATEFEVGRLLAGQAVVQTGRAKHNDAYAGVQILVLLRKQPLANLISQTPVADGLDRLEADMS